MPRNFDFIRSLNDEFFLTVRRAHLINLYELLVTSLSAKNYYRANRIVEILLQCPEVDYRNENTEWVQAGKLYHQIDPVSPPEAVLNPLIKYYESVMATQTSDTDQRSLAEVHYNLLELLFQRIENGDDEFEYVKDAIVHFIWL
ncbi:5770_t:CDS:2, partial [Racocetra fulgida]